MLQVELWTIYNGLQLAWEANWLNAIIEIDCGLAIKGVNGDCRGHSNRNLIVRIQKLCKCKWRVLFKQIPREANFVIDSLANLMKGFSIGAKIFHYAPPSVDDKIRMDGRFLLSNSAPTISS